MIFGLSYGCEGVQDPEGGEVSHGLGPGDNIGWIFSEFFFKCGWGRPKDEMAGWSDQKYSNSEQFQIWYPHGNGQIGQFCAHTFCHFTALPEEIAKI